MNSWNTIYCNLDQVEAVIKKFPIKKLNWLRHSHDNVHQDGSYDFSMTFRKRIFSFECIQITMRISPNSKSCAFVGAEYQQPISSTRYSFGGVTQRFPSKATLDWILAVQKIGYAKFDSWYKGHAL